MRIIAGEWKGLQLHGPKGMNVRPTTDRVKESMFNLMGPVNSDLSVVDLFAGSGSLGLEALSRGANHAIFVDRSGQSLRTLAANVERCRAHLKTSIFKLDWKDGLVRLREEGWQIGWIFVDPPYRLNLWEPVLKLLDELRVEVVNGVVCEHSHEYHLPPRVGHFEMFKERSYGDIVLTFYRSDRKEIVLKDDAE